jgi:TRAP-type mannitol/chloroaromatic compound transport system permease large subunit
MGIMERSGMAGDLLETIGQMFEPGGRLAIAVILVGIAGGTSVAAAVISMGLISRCPSCALWHRVIATGASVRLQQAVTAFAGADRAG